jgi:hypothetical protein
VYTAEVNRNQPACLLLVIDQSYSMSEPWANAGGSKAQALATAVNNILGTAVVLCSKGDERIYDYFEVGVLGYGSTVGPVLHGTSPAQPLIPISTVAHNPRRVDEVQRKIPDGAGGVVSTTVNLPVWVDPLHDGSTPMKHAIRQAEDIARDWCVKHPQSFPPIVINVTDGASTDGDPREAADRLRAITTDDGPTLLFNLHLSSVLGAQVCFPSTADRLPDQHATRLFTMSSQLPTPMAEAASGLGYPLAPEARGFMYNADATTVIEFLDIGTRAVTPTGLKQLTAGS